jgi:hypothetical protein
VLHRAILNETGRRVRLFGKKHYGMSLQPDWHPSDNDQSEEVESITVDGLAKDYVRRLRYPPLIKLDVEGPEIEAMRGARRLIDARALVIYEDHGKQSGHPTSCFVLAQHGLELRWMSPTRELECVTAIEQVATIKKDPRSGYNFFTYRAQSPWASLFSDGYVSRLRRKWSARGRAARIDSLPAARSGRCEAGDCCLGMLVPPTWGHSA